MGFDLSDAKTARQVVTKGLADFGFTGKTPAYKVQTRRGKIASTAGILHLESDGVGSSVNITKTDLGQHLPVRVTGLNDNWDAFYANLSTGGFKPLRVNGGETYVVIEDLEKGDRDIFVGHPVVCDNKRLVMNLTFEGGKPQLMMAVHNPTDETVTTNWNVAEGCGIDKEMGQLTLKPGETKTIGLKQKLTNSMLNR